MTSWQAHWRPKWRPVGEVYHCFVRCLPTRDYESLCGRFTKSPGKLGACRLRPPPVLRCARCDLAEASLAGKDESLSEDG
jgi:hypothetical protein